MISAKRISVRLGRSPILHDVDFAASPGRVTAIAGPNGSGKTTLLRALTGDVPFTGRVEINRRDLASLDAFELASMRAVLPQSANLSFPFTVREIVRLGLVGGRSGAAGGALETIIEEALIRVDLAGFAGRYYQELSGGEQQRVQLARVLCQVWRPVLDGVPRFLFLDEPVSSLDIRHQLVIMNIAREFAEAGGGVVAILHDLNLTAMYADQVAVVHRGRLAAAGEPRTVLTDDLLETVFECRLQVSVAPPSGGMFVLPQSAANSRTT
ncbi:MAG: heme ABC transporter ATP-binding protein [Rhizobiaceae bacterium]|nr:heme ABC transporter ATP-binding protein [Rhizobiaceae bacterium]